MKWRVYLGVVSSCFGFAGFPDCTASQQINGTVFEDPSGNPISGVEVILLDAAGREQTETLSNDLGRFEVSLPDPGGYYLLVRRIGYSTVKSDLFLVGPSDAPTVEIFLTINPIAMDSLEVVGEARVPHLEIAGFYTRQERGLGHFLLREEIEMRSPQRVTDVLYGLPGVRVSTVNSLAGEYDVIMSGGSTMFFGGTCYPSISVDGMVVRRGGGHVRRGKDATKPAQLGTWNELVHPAEIEAIEVYPGAAGLPVQVAGTVSPCGAILIWTRR